LWRILGGRFQGDSIKASFFQAPTSPGLESEASYTSAAKPRPHQRATSRQHDGFAGVMPAASVGAGAENGSAFFVTAIGGKGE
jgi:hypothetical protein